jgi:hypothetical protein
MNSKQTWQDEWLEWSRVILDPRDYGGGYREDKWKETEKSCDLPLIFRTT